MRLVRITLTRRGTGESHLGDKKTSLKGGFAVRTGLEPVTPCVTGMYSNQTELTHRFPIKKRGAAKHPFVAPTGIEPVFHA